jgi:2-polyprenyl-6-methoxyphenol hydroxylase-like FAD-dependent oxidoreductase
MNPAGVALMEKEFEFADVLVVGAGPVGLFASLLLAKRGLKVQIVERYPSPLQAPKAHVISPRSLEIFRAAGLDVDAMRQMATNPDDSYYVRFNSTLVGREYGKVPYERQDEAVLDVTPTPLISLPQPELEDFLGKLVAKEPNISLHRECVWTAVEQRDDRCFSTVTAGDEVRIYESRYVFACDGAGSAVREALGVEMDGDPVGQDCLNIHFQANLRNIIGERTAIIYWIMNLEIAGALIAHDIDNSFVFLVFGAVGVQSNDDAETILKSAIGADADVKVLRSVPWKMTAEVAKSYREGNVFLVGDSAHRFPPAGGLGMNTGLQDAHNLAWKIAAVVEGWAEPELLDTYESERRRIAVANSDQSQSNIDTAPRLAGAMMAAAAEGDGPLSAPVQEELDAAIIANAVTFDCLGMHLGFSYDADNPIPPAPNLYIPRANPGDRLPHAWIEKDGGRISVLDLLAPDAFTLLVGGDGDFDLGGQFGQIPVKSVCIGNYTLPDAWLSLTGLDQAALLLVRPDGHVFSYVKGNGTAELNSMMDGLQRHLKREKVVA